MDSWDVRIGQDFGDCFSMGEETRPIEVSLLQVQLDK